jgi:hypothetical protein
MRLWLWLIGWWRSLWDRPFRTVHLEEVPDSLVPKTIYVIGEGEYRWFVAMICPCGCGETLNMSLLEDARPRWKLSEHPNGTVSLQPSVWRKIGCRSHFFIVDGRVKWCR